MTFLTVHQPLCDRALLVRTLNSQKMTQISTMHTHLFTILKFKAFSFYKLDKIGAVRVIIYKLN